MEGPFDNIKDGELITDTPVNQTASADVTSRIPALLLRALAEELNAWFQYWIVRGSLVGDERFSIEETFENNGDDELEDHAEKLKERLIQLNVPLDSVAAPYKWDFATVNKFVELHPLTTNAAISLNINAEKAAISTYNEIINQARLEGDETTLQLAREILTDEEEHLQSLKDFDADLNS